MKKKVISLFVTGMLAVSMIAGCGSDNTADTSTSADTTADASTDAAADTTAEEAQTLMQVNMSMYYPARMDPVQEVHSSNYLESKKKTQTEIKWTTQQRKQSLQIVHP